MSQQFEFIDSNLEIRSRDRNHKTILITRFTNTETFYIQMMDRKTVPEKEGFTPSDNVDPYAPPLDILTTKLDHG